MLDTQGGSTVPRRQLGRYLRELRDKAGLTVKQAGTALEWSAQKIWRIETGQVSLRSLDVQQMCGVYGASDEFTEALMGLAKETKSKGWWHAYGGAVPEWFDLYVGLEGAASGFRTYEPELVPGLFQTEGYARTVIREHNPDENDDEIDRRVQLRIARQALLRRPVATPTLDVLLGEPVLRRPTGGPQVMAKQLDHLAATSDLPNVSLRVVPDRIGFHLGLVAGPFVILRFPLGPNGQESEPPTVYADGLTGGLYLDKPGEVERYDTAFNGIQAVSLDEPESRNAIIRAAEELRHE